MQWVQNASPAVDAASKYPTIITVCACLTLFMTAIVTLRVYVRAYMLRVMGLDDWTIVFSAICSIVYNGLCVGQSKWGLGLPIALRPPENLGQYSVINFAGRPFYMIGILGFKVALCLAYLRIITFGQRVYRVTVHSVLISCVLCHLAGTLVLLLQCNPVHKSWLPLTPGYCLPNVPTFEGLAGVTIVFDVFIFLLPIPLLWQLQINIRRKLALIGVFMLGIFTTVCSGLRLAQIPGLAVNGDSTMLVLWGTIEMNVGIALTCIPTLAPLFTYFREKSTYNNYYPRSKYGLNSHELQSGGSHSFKTTPPPPDGLYPEPKISDPAPGHDDDANSQKRILSMDLPASARLDTGASRNEIKKTVEVDIQYEDLRVLPEAHARGSRAEQELGSIQEGLLRW